MNKLLYCFFLSFSVIATSACTDDKEEREFPPAPDFSLMILKENLHSDGGDVLRTDTYVYDNNKLTTHTTLQEFYGQSLTHETTLSYSGNEVTLADENGNTAIYILGSAGYATECTYKLSDQVRKYTFTYSGEYLTRIDEEINSTPYSSVELAYDDNGNLSHIIANGLQTNYQAGNTENLYQLPCLQVCETYPLSFHNDAIYAGLLGRQSKHLIIGNTPEENKEEYTKYSYELDENEKPTGIIAKTTSTGTVIDINGNAYDETKTDTRTIGITIE